MKAVLHSFSYCCDFLRQQVADLAAADMVAQPCGIRNHPAWTLGHLACVLQSVGNVLGVAPWLGNEWSNKFDTGSVPTNDVDFYSPKEELLARLADAHSRIATIVEVMKESELAKPFPDPSLHAVFPCIGHFLTQVLVAHTAYHVGQIGIWRRAMSLPPLGRSFE